jgi:hypothetical protein
MLLLFFPHSLFSVLNFTTFSKDHNMILCNIYLYSIISKMSEIFMCYIFTTEEWNEECHVSYRVETNSTNV